MKTRYDNYVVDHTNAVYVEYKTKLSWLSGPDSVIDENQTNNDMTDDHIGLIYIETETELPGLIWSTTACDEN